MGVSVNHLQRHSKTGRLSFRRVYPAELRPYIPGKPVELKRSLGTASISEPKAIERFQAAAAEYEAAITRARKAATNTFERLDERTIVAATALYFRRWGARAVSAILENAAVSGSLQADPMVPPRARLVQFEARGFARADTKNRWGLLIEGIPCEPRD